MPSSQEDPCCPSWGTLRLDVRVVLSCRGLISLDKLSKDRTRHCVPLRPLSQFSSYSRFPRRFYHHAMANTKETAGAPSSHARDDGITTLEATHLADAVGQVKCSPWTLNMFRLYGVMLCAYFCACLNGFDGSVMGRVTFIVIFSRRGTPSLTLPTAAV